MFNSPLYQNAIISVFIHSKANLSSISVEFSLQNIDESTSNLIYRYTYRIIYSYAYVKSGV